METLGWVVLVVLLATATGAVADRKGQSGAAWFVVGLVAPVLGLLIALVVLRPMSATVPYASDVTPEEAARHSVVARLLGETPGLSVRAIAERSSTPTREVAAQLAALRNLGLATRDPDGRWHLVVDRAT